MSIFEAGYICGIINKVLNNNDTSAAREYSMIKTLAMKPPNDKGA
jgi:hypothetical protein